MSRPVVLTLGLQSLPSLVEALHGAGVRFNAYAEALLASDWLGVSPTPRTVTVVVLSVNQLGWPTGAPIDQVLDEVAHQGLAPCPLEVALLLRLAWREEPAVPRVTVASPRAHPDETSPRGFYLRDDPDGCWLRAYVASDDWIMSPEERLALLRSPR